jgi:hypothetical protein
MSESIKLRICKVNYDYVDCSEDYKPIFSGITDWEEVDLKTYQILMAWASKKNGGRYADKYGEKYIIVQSYFSEPTIPQCVAEYAEMIKKEEEEAAKRKIKLAAAAKKREKESAEKTRLKDLKKLKALADKQGIKLPEELS